MLGWSHDTLPSPVSLPYWRVSLFMFFQWECCRVGGKHCLGSVIVVSSHFRPKLLDRLMHTQSLSACQTDRLVLKKRKRSTAVLVTWQRYVLVAWQRYVDHDLPAASDWCACQLSIKPGSRVVWGGKVNNFAIAIIIIMDVRTHARAHTHMQAHMHLRAKQWKKKFVE